MKGVRQVVLNVSIVGFSWLAMQAVHEAGHVAAAMLSGGTVTEVFLHPLSVSRADVFPDSLPLLVVWAGPIVGCLLPVFVLLLVSILRVPGIYMYRFFAGFCLVMNGVYVGGGSLPGLADAGVMLEYGSSP